MFRILTSVTAIAILLVSCAPAAAPELISTSVETKRNPTSSPVVRTLTPTPSPSPIPSITPIPPEISEAVRQTYLAMLFIQVNSRLVEEAAYRTQSGELTGFDQIGALLAIAAFIEGIDQSLLEISPPDLLISQWDGLTEVHQQTKRILGEWFNAEIDSNEVIERITPILDTADTTLLDVEDILAIEFAFDVDDLTSERERILIEVSEVFDSTPSPSP